ncbi:MarR family winged helix-turn-helix transcriptional regulator [Ruegeria arenilitoris]|uniref:MarR family winged helix-turn-helix transcriptional regulator n=1 Tax=Ruegeria arenilitoris TaxID=1173585 RepID=UPI0014804B7A|nr:MarR family transcriptional regulator [Ruegeria arenilitoris]
MQLDSFFPYRLAVASEAFSRNLTDVYERELGLSREEWRLLFLLANAESVTSLDLARRTTLDKVQVSRAAKRLDEKGLIIREISDTDRRIRVYRCTPEGLREFQLLEPKVRERANRMLDALTPEDREALERGITALMKVAKTD